MKKVLVVAYAFPPVGGAGVQRVTKFVKYLREYNWEPVVITVTNPSVPVIDQALLLDVPVGVSLYKAVSLEPSYAKKQILGKVEGGRWSQVKLLAKKILASLLLPDIQVLWWPGLIWRLICTVREEQPDCIFVTAPPFSSFVPVVAIGAFFKVPVVVDFRDEWTFSRNHLENAQKGSLARKLDCFLEKYVVTRCSAIVAASQSYIDSMVANYRLSSEKATAITNGFDEEDFVFNSEPHEKSENEIVIVYAGTVWKATSLQYFVDAIGIISRNAAANAPRIKVHIFGRIVESEILGVLSVGGQDIIKTFGYVDHKELMAILASSDILLLALSDLPGAEKIITAKVFEYMATGKHIFAIVPEGETKKILANDYDNVTFANPGDVTDIKLKLDGIISSFDSIKMKKGKCVKQYSRKTLAGKLVKVLDKITSNKNI